MRKLLIVGAVGVVALAVAVVAVAGNGPPVNPNSAGSLTLAVFGDAPYGSSNADAAAFEATPAFVDSVNHDPEVDLVAFVGDIHSGSQACTQAYDQSIYDLWAGFKDPLVYTPGDNEWSDCQKSKQLTSTPPVSSYAGGDPLANLALVRSIFFPSTGYTLGERKKQVISQAQLTPPTGHETNTEYVENVMWEQSKTLFLTLNIPGGSNNDDDNWFGNARTQPQTDEIAHRTQADLDWIDAAFIKAQADGVGALVIIEQADMWDLDGKPTSHIANYAQFINSIASHTLTFAKPVLLFNGDSHMYRSDNPLVDGASCVIESGNATVPCSDDAYDNQQPNRPLNPPPVSNFHRIVVHGGTTFPAQPLEYTRLTDDPRANNTPSTTAFGPFTWTRVQT